MNPLDASAAPDWGHMAMTLFGGLALFLFGMQQLATALKKIAGDRLRAVLGRLTGNRVSGVLTGTFVTAIIQSSTVTTVMLVGFVSAGLMTLSQSIGVILGAGIGTTITAQIIAFKVTKVALWFVALGFGFAFLARNDRVRQFGELVMGSGLIFFGMVLMSDGMAPLRSYAPFLALMEQVENPALAIFLGALFTAAVQASAATLAVVITLASQGLISLEAGIGIALGANIGTCLTAGLAAIGKPREAMRVALAHVMFKVVGVLMIVGFIPWFADQVRAVSPQSAGLAGAAALAADVPRQIANAHTLFNVGVALAFLPFTGLFARLCEKLVPDQPVAPSTEIKPQYLEPDLLDTPALALGRVRLELFRSGKIVEQMMASALTAVVQGNERDLSALAAMDDRVDVLHFHIIQYLGRLSRGNLSDRDAQVLSQLMSAANMIESIGDVIQTDLVGIGRKRLRKGLVFSDASVSVLAELHGTVSAALATALRAVAAEDEPTAKAVRAMKSEVHQQFADAAEHQAERLLAAAPDRVAHYAAEMAYVEHMNRIFWYARRLTRPAMI